MNISNRTYHHKYQQLEEFEAGIQLLGSEVKSIRTGNMRLENSFVKIFDDGAWMFNAEVPAYRFASYENYDPVRKRKLLLNKKELERLKTKLQSAKGLTLIPISCYNKGRHLKMGIALSRGRGDIEKKNVEKKATMARNQQRDMKEYMKK